MRIYLHVGFYAIFLTGQMKGSILSTLGVIRRHDQHVELDGGTFEENTPLDNPARRHLVALVSAY